MEHRNAGLQSSIYLIPESRNLITEVKDTVVSYFMTT